MHKMRDKRKSDLLLCIRRQFAYQNQSQTIALGLKYFLLWEIEIQHTQKLAKKLILMYAEPTKISIENSKIILKFNGTGTKTDWYRILITDTAINISLAYPRQGSMGSASFPSLFITFHQNRVYMCTNIF